MNRKRKNAITLLSLLLVTAALIGFYLWYSNKDRASEKGSNTDNKGQTTEQVVNTKLELAELDISLVDSLYFKNSKADLKLYIEDSVWKSEADPKRPINQTNVNNMLKLITKITAKRIIVDKPEDPAEYGLSEPIVYVRAGQSDGKSVVLNIGDQALAGDGYYAQVNDSEIVYLIDTSFGEGFLYSDLDMTALESTPKINAEHIYHILVEKKAADNFELLYNTENKQDTTGSGMFPWVVLQPYEEGYAADSSKVSDVTAKYAKFPLLHCVDYSDADSAIYGLDAPEASVLVEYYEYYTQKLDAPEKDPITGEEITEKTYYDDKSFKLYIGGQDSNSNYYVRIDGSESIYTMAAEVIEPMLKTEPFNLLTSFITIPNIESVNRISVTIEDKLYTMEIKRGTEENESGETVKKADYYYNGKLIEEGIFKDVYQIMIRAGYDAPMKEPILEEEFDATLVISYELSNGQVLTASYMPYNESFYIVKAQDKPIRFFSDKREIEEIMAEIKRLGD